MSTHTAAARRSEGRRARSEQLLWLRAETIRTRKEYLRRLRALPQPIGEACAAFYERRVDRVRPKPLLGEYLPWLLGDLAGIARSTTARVAECWLPFYLQVLAVDDLLDTPSSDEATLPIVAGVFSEQGHAGYARLLGSDERFWAPFETYVLRMAAAGAREMQMRRNRIARISAQDWIEAGEKIELVKVCYLSLVLAEGKRPDPEHLRALQDFAVGIQLFDDISDWEEDFAIGNYTPLLVRAFVHGTADVGDVSANSDRVFLRIVETGALENCAAEGEERLTRAAVRSGFETTSRGMRFLTGLTDDLRSIRTRAAALGGFITEVRRTFPAGEEANLLGDARLRERLTELRTTLRVVAQSS